MSLSVSCLVNVLVPDLTPGPFASALDTLSTLGYSSVVLPPLDPRGLDVDDLRSQFSSRGLSPITIFGGMTPDANVQSADLEIRRAGAAALRQTVDLTVNLGGTQMNGVPYGIFGKSDVATDPLEFIRAAREVGEIADYAAQRGVTMTFEVLNRYETSVVNTAEQAMEFVEQSKSDNLRIHLDTYHMSIEESDMFAAISLALPKLGYLELGQSSRGFLSKGVVDVPAVVRHAVNMGYSGRIGVEAFSRPLMMDFVADALHIWREPFASGRDVAADAMGEIMKGLSAVIASAPPTPAAPAVAPTAPGSAPAAPIAAPAPAPNVAPITAPPAPEAHVPPPVSAFPPTTPPTTQPSQSDPFSSPTEPQTPTV